MLTTRKFLFFIGACLLIGLSSTAQTKYILTSSPSTLNAICSRHGLTTTNTVWSNPGYTYAVYLVTGSSSTSIETMESQVLSDPDVDGFEAVQPVSLPELSGATSANLAQSTEAILQGLPGRTAVS